MNEIKISNVYALHEDATELREDLFYTALNSLKADCDLCKGLELCEGSGLGAKCIECGRVILVCRGR